MKERKEKDVLFARARHCFGLLAFVIGALLCAGPHLYALLGIAWLRNESARQKRDRVIDWQTVWGEYWYWCSTVIGGVRVTFMFDASFLECWKDEPFLLFGNHTGAFDVPLFAHALLMFRADGRADYRSVAKAMIGEVPILGRAWKHTTGFMQRDGQKGDIDAVVRLTDTAIADRASILIYPEGTTLTAPFAAERRGNRSTLSDRLRRRGFRLTSRRSGYRMLSKTMYWRDFDPWWLSDEGYVPHGNDLVVEFRVLPALPAGATDADADAVLEAEFRRKDEWLASVE